MDRRRRRRAVGVAGSGLPFPVECAAQGRLMMYNIGVAFVAIQPACFTSRKVNPYPPAEVSELSE